MSWRPHIIDHCLRHTTITKYPSVSVWWLTLSCGSSFLCLLFPSPSVYSLSRYDGSWWLLFALTPPMCHCLILFENKSFYSVCWHYLYSRASLPDFKGNTAIILHVFIINKSHISNIKYQISKPAMCLFVSWYFPTFPTLAASLCLKHIGSYWSHKSF